MPETLMTLAEVQAATKIKRSTIYAGMGSGTFPRALKLPGGGVRWRTSDVDAWIAALQAGEYATPRKATAAAREAA